MTAVTQQIPFRFRNYQEYASELRKQIEISGDYNNDIKELALDLFEGTLTLNYFLKNNHSKLISEGLTKIFTALSSFIEIAFLTEDAKKNIYLALEKVLWHPQYLITPPLDELQLLHFQILELIGLIKQEERGAFRVFVKNNFPRMYTNLVNICLHFSLPPLAVLHNGLKEE